VRTLIIEADGASRGNPGEASYGAVVRDADTGELLAELAEYLGRATNNVAEYRGVIAGLEAARQIDPEARVDVRLDSKLVVEQLSGRWQVKHPDMKPLAARAKSLFPASGAVTFTWVPRSRNKHADRLANEALDAAAKGKTWTSKTPVGGASREPSNRPPGKDRAGGEGAGGEGADGEHVRGEGGGESAGLGAGSGGMSERLADGGHAPGEGASARHAAGLGVASERSPGGHVWGGGEASRPRGGATGTVTGADIATGASAPSAPRLGWSADVGTPTRLLLLRHGVTPLTGEKRFSGRVDPSLTPDGLAQARAAALRLAGTSSGDAVFGRIDAIVASPLTRAQQTAAAVASLTGLAVRTEPGFREMDFGAFEGLTFAEAQARFPAELLAFLSSVDAAAPGGESVSEAAARAAVARDRTIARFPRKTVLVVTHVTPIKTLVCQALGAPLSAVHRMELSAASLTVVDFYSDGILNVRCVNDTAHLRAVVHAGAGAGAELGTDSAADAGPGTETSVRAR
jgi:broad specificity phosphatase PhoE/ribonuclease HI